jgi:hypothetical protein
MACGARQAQWHERLPPAPRPAPTAATGFLWSLQSELCFFGERGGGVHVGILKAQSVMTDNTADAARLWLRRAWDPIAFSGKMGVSGEGHK